MPQLKSSTLLAVDSASGLQEVWFRATDTVLHENGEALLACALLPCMKVGRPVVVNTALSERLRANIVHIQTIYRQWDQRLQQVEISPTNPAPVSHRAPQRVGAFFSGGLDSSYTFLKNREEITDLVFVRGFDITLGKVVEYEQASAAIRNVARHFGKRLIEIETNIYPYFRKYVRWGPIGHGAAMATVGHLLSSIFKRIYIPSSFTYANLFPWGTHPLLDPLWSTEGIEFVHDGCEASRVDKASVIAGFEVVLQNLRVCPHASGGHLNCGECEKCVRTMINLRVAGALHRCTVFKTSLDIDNVLKIRSLDRVTRIFIMENLRALEDGPSDAALRTALEKVLGRLHLMQRIREYLKARVRRTTAYRTYRQRRNASKGGKRRWLSF